MDEEWLAVPGYEGLYEVSSLGRVRSLDRIVSRKNSTPRKIKGVTLKTFYSNDGYERVELNKDGRGIKYTVHSLVASAFIPKPEGNVEVCHGPAGIRDNSVNNLRWDTRRENTLDQVREGKHHMARRTACPRNHKLCPPNLRIKKNGHKECLACSRARTYCRRTGEDFVAVSNVYYERIMNE